jgi:hypothetical protein
MGDCGKMRRSDMTARLWGQRRLREMGNICQHTQGPAIPLSWTKSSVISVEMRFWSDARRAASRCTVWAAGRRCVLAARSTDPYLASGQRYDTSLPCLEALKHPSQWPHRPRHHLHCQPSTSTSVLHPPPLHDTLPNPTRTASGGRLARTDRPT